MTTENKCAAGCCCASLAELSRQMVFGWQSPHRLLWVCNPLDANISCVKLSVSPGMRFLKKCLWRPHFWCLVFRITLMCAWFCCQGICVSGGRLSDWQHCRSRIWRCRTKDFSTVLARQRSIGWLGWFEVECRREQGIGHRSSRHGVILLEGKHTSCVCCHGSSSNLSLALATPDCCVSAKKHSLRSFFGRWMLWCERWALWLQKDFIRECLSIVLTRQVCKSSGVRLWLSSWIQCLSIPAYCKDQVWIELGGGEVVSCCFSFAQFFSCSCCRLM